MQKEYNAKSLIEKYWRDIMKDEERTAVEYSYKYDGFCALEGLPLGYSVFALKLLFNTHTKI
jgi:hypothetical protein